MTPSRVIFDENGVPNVKIKGDPSDHKGIDDISYELPGIGKVLTSQHNRAASVFLNASKNNLQHSPYTGLFGCGALQSKNLPKN